MGGEEGIFIGRVEIALGVEWRPPYSPCPKYVNSPPRTRIPLRLTTFLLSSTMRNRKVRKDCIIFIYIRISSSSNLYSFRFFRLCGHILSWILPSTRASHRNTFRSAIHEQANPPSAKTSKKALKSRDIGVKTIKSASQVPGSNNM